MDRLSRKDMLLNLLAGNSSDVFLNYALALEFESLGDLKGAEEQLFKTLSLDAEYVPCFFRLGQIKEKKGEVKEALDYYKKGYDIAKKQGNEKTAGELNAAIIQLED